MKGTTKTIFLKKNPTSQKQKIPPRGRDLLVCDPGRSRTGDLLDENQMS
jgi:hypothetical protein